MLGKVKQILGIEGVNVSLQLPVDLSKKTEELTGEIVLSSKSDQTINSILVQFIERFSRGSKKEKRIDEYIIGKLFLEGPMVIKADQTIVKKFTLNYEISKSEMDHIEDQNFLFRGFVKLAKMINKVKSEYRVEVEVDVKGTTLNPISKEYIQLN